ncbi:MAG: mechanosensitive ion channel [Marinifilum sp.]|jgi:small-conductance mechanosensitive channel|nr:mechanosensitive ion channel [Marinifilum sp.]
MASLKSFLNFELVKFNNYSLTVVELLSVVVILLATILLLWIIKKALFRKHRFRKLDTGSTYALYQIIKYFIWIVAIGLMLETVGIKLTLLLAGSAALLVGIGLGLQQTFNDVISGVILLTERSVKLGDILEIDDDIIKIQEIGLRTSKGLNRDDISIIIPNSLITTNKVINWSHQTKKTRFRIDIGVAYGSDVDLVIKVLEDSVKEHVEIFNNDLVEARFLNFGNSSLDFQVLFFSENVFRIERIKSEIRKIINRKFIENDITIPFPQMDLHLKSGFSSR